MAGPRPARLIDEVAGLRHVVLYAWSHAAVAEIVDGLFRKDVLEGALLGLVGERRERDAWAAGLVGRGIDRPALEAEGRAVSVPRERFYASGRLDGGGLRRILDEARATMASRGLRRAVIVGFSAGALCAAGARDAALEADLARSVKRVHDGILVEEMGGGLSLARN